MQTEAQSTLTQADMTSESFIGTIRIFDMTAVTDPTVPADLDVSACFDNAQSSNTSRATGKVIPDTGPAAQHYYRYTDQLAKDSRRLAGGLGPAADLLSAGQGVQAVRRASRHRR